MRRLAAAGFAVLLLVAAGCGATTAASNEATTTLEQPPPSGEFGSYPADPSLDEKEVVETYVDAIDARDGEAFCRVVASWIAGHFDIAGTDPDANFSRPIECPEIVRALTDFPWENQERDFKGASVAAFGDLDERGDLVGVPVTITLRLEEEERGEYDEPLQDVVWVTKEAGAWRVAKLSTIAAWAALMNTERSDDLIGPPDLSAARRSYAAEVAEAKRIRSSREGSYTLVQDTATCPAGKTFPDPAGDVADYHHPAPAGPTPQLPAADIRLVSVHAAAERVCVLFELAGNVRSDTVFDFAIASPKTQWGRSGFSQGFEVELRSDGRARVTSGRGRDQRPLSVPAQVGVDGNRLFLSLDARSFASGEPFPGSAATPSPKPPFRLRADVSVRVSAKRTLHDDLGTEASEPFEYTYP